VPRSPCILTSERRSVGDNWSKSCALRRRRACVSSHASIGRCLRRAVARPRQRSRSHPARGKRRRLTAYEQRIHQRTAAQRQLIANVVARQGSESSSRYRSNATDRAVVRGHAFAEGSGVVAVMHALHEDATGTARSLGNGIRFAFVAGERLFAEDVLARLQRADRPWRVQRIGQPDVNRIDGWIGKQRVVRRMHARHAEPLREITTARCIARRNGIDRDAAVLCAPDARPRSARHEMRRGCRCEVDRCSLQVPGIVQHTVNQRSRSSTGQAALVACRCHCPTDRWRSLPPRWPRKLHSALGSG